MDICALVCVTRELCISRKVNIRKNVFWVLDQPALEI